jgi:hypothetical protein
MSNKPWGVRESAKKSFRRGIPAKVCATVGSVTVPIQSIGKPLCSRYFLTRLPEWRQGDRTLLRIRHLQKDLNSADNLLTVGPGRQNHPHREAAMQNLDLVGMFMLGLFGTGHCIGMCGPLIFALPGRSGKFMSHVWYHSGRVITYVAIGGILGGAGGFLAHLTGLETKADVAGLQVAIRSWPLPC